MAELEYFAANAPLAFRARNGRLIAAGILMILIGGLVTAGGLLGLLQMINRRYVVADEWPPVIIATTCTAGGLWLFTAGLGCIGRYRWSRPMAMVALSAWLTIATALIAFSVLTAFGRAVWSSGVDVWMFFVLIPTLFSVFIAVGPAVLLIGLLRHDDVRLTLEHADPRQCWTDGISVRRWSVAFTLMLNGLIWLLVLLGSSGFWPLTNPWPRITAYAAVPMIFSCAMSVLAGTGTTSCRVALAIGTAAIATLAYVGYASNYYTTFSIAYETQQIVFVMAVTAACLFRIGRERRALMTASVVA